MAVNISQLQRARAEQLGSDLARALPRPQEYRKGDPSEFGNILKDAVDRVDDVQKLADGELTSWVAGEQEDLHEVMIAMNHAQLSFQLSTQLERPGGLPNLRRLSVWGPYLKFYRQTPMSLSSEYVLED